MSSSNTSTLSGLAVQWEWEGDKGVWQQYPIDIQQQISQAFDAGNKEVKKSNFFFSDKKFSCCKDSY
jgi:hypothetical protein